MAVTRRTKPKDTSQIPAVDNAAVQAFLKKGGRTATTEPETEEAPLKPTRFSLTIPGDICQEVDKLCQAGRLKISRHKWVLDAVIEKLERDGTARS